MIKWTENPGWHTSTNWAKLGSGERYKSMNESLNYPASIPTFYNIPLAYVIVPPWFHVCILQIVETFPITSLDINISTIAE